MNTEIKGSDRTLEAKKMKAYVILVEHIPTGSKHISQEAYTSLEKAQNFCDNRSTTMEKINDFSYKNDYTGYKYQIVETNVI